LDLCPSWIRFIYLIAMLFAIIPIFNLVFLMWFPLYVRTTNTYGILNCSERLTPEDCYMNIVLTGYPVTLNYATQPDWNNKANSCNDPTTWCYWSWDEENITDINNVTSTIRVNEACRLGYNGPQNFSQQHWQFQCTSGNNETVSYICLFDRGSYSNFACNGSKYNYLYNPSAAQCWPSVPIIYTPYYFSLDCGNGFALRSSFYLYILGFILLLFWRFIHCHLIVVNWVVSILSIFSISILDNVPLILYYRNERRSFAVISGFNYLYATK